MRRFVWLALVLALASCKSTRNPEQEFFEKVSQLTKEELLAKGDALAEKRRWEEARKHYSFLADSFPNDPLGRRAALKVADTFFAQRDLESLTEAQLRYRDFSNRFPSDPARAYALLMLGKCSFQQHRGPQRDLGPVREAAASFRLVMELFPDSPEAREAAELYQRCREDLAAHELEVARFHARVQAWEGAWQRLTYLLATYPETLAAREAEPLLAEARRIRGEEPAANPATAEPTPAPDPR
ncbi:MAG TPA: outer membrane protein assembly factor BamD [Thermoanaerobaculaceae bacterium]|nr:outer membrane protein assembly factor BamD [Thermoanaerobaculaceae bacterium]HRS15615.1 outer membrane protein assembly factor BamD [Thermoanaerobaculaceae bacterium]